MSWGWGCGDLTSIPWLSRNPGSSSSGRTSGSATTSRAATVGRWRVIVHGWTLTNSRGKSEHAATMPPFFAHLSALSHHGV